MNINIVDNVFLYSGARSASLWGDNFGLGPQHFAWAPGCDPDKTCWFSDAAIYNAGQFSARRKIAWLCEPPGYREAHYQYIDTHHQDFDFILTHDRRLLEKHAGDNRFLFYPMGGSMISQELWRVYPKTKMVSMVVSWKNEAAGHRLRHQIITELAHEPFWAQVDVLGSGYGDPVRKFDAVRDYRYSIVIEGESCDYFFGEKSIDAYSTGTIPIYWGCPSYGRFGFDMSGIIQIASVGELATVLQQVTNEDTYLGCLSAIQHNLENARQYRCCEDWIWEHYKFLFEEV